MDNNDDKTVYRAVLNHEEQYSIWPAHLDLPLGWRDAGKSGTKAECLEYIGQVWTDMRRHNRRRINRALTIQGVYRCSPA
jgi:MbtH protein